MDTRATHARTHACMQYIYGRIRARTHAQMQHRCTQHTYIADTVMLTNHNI